MRVSDAQHEDGGGPFQRKTLAAGDGQALTEQAEKKARPDGTWDVCVRAIERLEGKVITLVRRCMRRTASPQYKFAMFSLAAVVPSYLLVVAMPVILPRLGYSEARQYALAGWLSVQFLYNFLMTQLTDPGGSQLVKPVLEVTGQFELDLGSSSGADADKTLPYAPRWCDHCRRWKPPRSHHCSVCQRCTLRMDHHSPLAGCCIGIRNHGHLVLMFTFALLGLLYAAALLVHDASVHFAEVSKLLSRKEIVQHLMRKRDPLGPIVTLAPKLFKIIGYEAPILAVLTSIALPVVCAWGIPVAWLAASNVTFLEQEYPLREYVEFQPKVYCPLGSSFYYRSVRSSLIEIMGRRWIWRLLLPVAGGPVDLTPATRPTASARGLVEMERLREQVRTKGVARRVGTVEELGVRPDLIGKV